MYIVLIAWLYVTLLMAVSEPSWVSGILTFVAYGLLPGSLFWWLFGGRRQHLAARRAAERERQAAHQQDALLADPVSHQGD